MAVCKVERMQRARLHDASEGKAHRATDIAGRSARLEVETLASMKREFMCSANEYLRVKAASAGLGNVEPVLASAVSLPLVDDVADLVVSNYCLHELRHPDKHRALAEAGRVLKPGGRLVVGDMMFSFNPMQARDRHVVSAKLRSIASRGLPGAWRLSRTPRGWRAGGRAPGQRGLVAGRIGAIRLRSGEGRDAGSRGRRRGRPGAGEELDGR